MTIAARNGCRFATFLLLLSLSVLTLPWQTIRAEDAPKPADKVEDWSVAPLLPPETLFVVTSPNSKKMTDKFKQTGLWQLYSNADVQKAFRGPLMAAQMGMAAAELQAGIKIPEILSWINQGEVTFAMLACDHRNEKDEPVPDLLISIQAREKTQAVLDEISKRVDQLNANAGNQLDITQTPVGNYTVHRIGHIAVPFSISYTVCDGQILVTLGEGYIEKILALHERMKAGPLQAAAKPEVLSQTSAFLATTRKAPDADFIAFANWDGLRDNKILNVRPRNDRESADWELIGLNTVHALSYTVSVKGQSLREVLYIDAPAAVRRGLLTLFDGAAGLSSAALAQAPRNAVLAVALNFSPDKLSDKIAELASIDNANARQELDQALALAGKQLNVDVKKEIFGALTGQALLSVAMTPKHPKLPVAMPQALLTIQIKDAAALKNVLASARTALSEKFDYTEIQTDGNNIVTAREKFPQGHKPRQIAYTVDKNDLLVSLYPLALRDELHRRQSATSGSPSDKARPAGSLNDDDDFKTAMANTSGTPQFLVYADTGAIATALYDTLIPIAQLEPKPPQVDLSVLPSADVLVQNLTGSIFSLNSDADGVTASGYSPAGVVSLFAITVSAAIKDRRNAGGGVGGAGGGAMQQRKRSVLDAVNQGLHAYAKENNGAFPATVKDLQPKYLPQLTTELNFVEYHGKQDKDNKVVAHSSEKLPGPITVLLQNGTVADIRRESLGKTLKEGFSAEAAVTEAKQAPDF